MHPTEAANGFAAMGSESRLQVLRLLIRAGEDGLSVGEVQERCGIPHSTLAHHLKFLAGAGLIAQHRVGRSVICRAHYPILESLAQFILDECCADTNRRFANDG